MRSTPTVVLVHGAFADASGYAGVIRELRTRAIQVRAPMNPLRSLAFDADAIARYTTTLEGPIILVGHSYGGAVISQAASVVNGVIALVFLSAFAPDQGESCASVQEPFPPSLLASTSVPSPYDAPGAPGGPDLFIKIADFHRTFCADLPAEVAAPMAVSQRPLSAAALTERDQAISPDCQRFMAKRMNANVESVSGGSHAAFIAHPDVAASVILRAIETTRGPEAP
jgi:pimeloyl-ACP methyl ester carboxylesterase